MKLNKQDILILLVMFFFVLSTSWYILSLFKTNFLYQAVFFISFAWSLTMLIIMLAGLKNIWK